jgi:transcriptional regulator with XRE-family HTH domain
MIQMSKTRGTSAEDATLTDLIRQAIQESGLSLNELARQSGVSAPQLSRFLRGERTITLDAADKLVQFLQIELRLPKRERKGK